MTVTLLSYTQINPKLISYELPDKPEEIRKLVYTHKTFAQSQLEFAGRLCYNSTSKLGTAPNFIQSCIERGHEDIIEHSSATFLIEGISRTASHQLVRHRLASYSQESQRYVDQSGAEFVTPDSIANNEQAAQIWQDIAALSNDSYKQLRELGIRKEDARFALLEGATTRIVVSMNFRSWRHFLWLRCEKDAQWEIRTVAFEVLKELHEIAPQVFGDIKAHFDV